MLAFPPLEINADTIISNIRLFYRRFGVPCQAACVTPYAILPQLLQNWRSLK